MALSLSTLTLIISILALLAAIYSMWQMWSLNRLRKSFFAGSTALDLESVIVTLEQEITSGNSRQEVLENELAALKHEFEFAVQKVGVVRFNPFGDGGGNFSFALALLDAQNNGVIITSMHGREQNRIYTKKFINGQSDSQLTDEELQAVAIANQKNQEPVLTTPSRGRAKSK